MANCFVKVGNETISLSHQGRNATHEFYTGKLSDGRIVLWTIGEEGEDSDGNPIVRNRTHIYPLGESPKYLGR